MRAAETTRCFRSPESMHRDIARTAYAAGEPLRATADHLGCTVDELCSSLAKQPTTELELERARSVRQRSLATDEVIYENRGLLYRLNDAGIPWSDTPKVLKALTTDVDVEVAIELVNIPGVPSDRIERALPSRSLGDRLSLLYIAGRHHGVEPDYQLALGKMSLTAVAELRDLLHPNFPFRRLAEILAVIETTALAIRAREIQTLSYSDYDAMAKQVTRRLGKISRDPSEPWPVPGPELRRRYGHGVWEDAVNTIGLRLSSADGRLAEEEFLRLSTTYTDECIDFEYPMSIEIYDRWVTADASFVRIAPPRWSRSVASAAGTPPWQPSSGKTKSRR